MATLGMYGVVIMLFRMTRKAPPAVEDEDDFVPKKQVKEEIPSITDDSFDKWAKIPGNLAKWEKSLETSFQ